MISKQILAHFCEHCAKLYQVPQACKKHEVVCNRNPENYRPCLSCVHLEKKEMTIYMDTPWSEVERNVKIFHCVKFSKFLHCPKTEHKGNAIELGDYENNPMPKQCDGFTSNEMLINEMVL